MSKEIINNIELYNADCFDIMPLIADKSVDLVLTDPPYNIARDNNFHTMKNANRVGLDFGEWDKGFDLFSYIDEIPRILKKDASVIIFNSWLHIGQIAKYCESVGLEIKDMLRWVKSNPMPRNRNRRYIADYEVAVWCVNKGANWTFNRQNDKYQIPEFRGSLTPQGERTGHTTQKPLYLMEELLKIHSNEGDVVIDMFSGSGTTGVACQNTNRKFIGIEKETNYFDIAVKRIKDNANLFT